MNWPEIIRKNEKWLIVGLLVVVAAVHGFNMWGFPYLENDEGVYVSRAWALLNESKLDIYTYWYDHAPGGWMLISAWGFLTGGFDTFGIAINSGRAFMLVIHIASAALVYFIGKRLTGNPLVAAGAVLIFSMSPLAIYFQRRVLLDNIMVWWVLLSLALLLRKRVHLSHIFYSGLAFGAAVLTKESAVMFGPALAYAVYVVSQPSQRRFAIVFWLLISMVVVSWFVVFAGLKGELWPATAGEHVSLISSYRNFAGRGEGVPFWRENSDLRFNLADWWLRDPYFMAIAGGTLAAAIGASFRNIKIRIITLLALGYGVFLIRGGLVINFYLLPMIPFIALLAAMLISKGYQRILSRPAAGAMMIITLLSGVALMQIYGQGSYLRDNETTPQIAALKWVKENVKAGDNVVIDDTLLVDLRADNRDGTNSAWKVESDPEVKEGALQGDWRNIDYLILSHEMVKQSERGAFKLIPEALANATLIKEWREDNGSFIDIQKLISTNGDWMSVYKVQAKDEIAFSKLWSGYLSRFRQGYGQIVNPSNGFTTSAGQAGGMWMALMQDDQDNFDEIWRWTKHHLQNRATDNLFSWLWKGDEILDPATAAGADQDIAMALWLAGEKWDKAEYLDEAKIIINDIWRQEVRWVDGRYVVTVGAGGAELYYDGYLVNPGYLSPAYYRMFAEADSLRPWQTVAQDAYVWLDKISQMEGNQTGLPVQKVIIDSKSGEVRAATQLFGDEAGWTGENSWMTFWRVSLDAQWWQAPKAYAYLNRMAPEVEKLWSKHKQFGKYYDEKGQIVDPAGNMTSVTGALTALSIADNDLAREVYGRQVVPKFTGIEPGWPGVMDPEVFSWLTLATALYLDRLP